MDVRGLVMLLILGVVVQHGNAFLDTHNYHLVTIFPSNDQLTKALSARGGYVVGFSSKGFLVLKFEVNESGNYILRYYVSKVSFKNPMKVLIYIKNKKSENWKLVKRGIANMGWHEIPLRLNKGTLLVKFEFTNTVKQGAGASLIDYICLKKVSKVTSVVDWETLQLFAFGRWFPIAIVAVIVFSSIFGACILDANRSNLALGFVLSFILLISLFFNINIFILYYLMPSAFSIIFSTLVYGTVCAFLTSKLFYKLSKNTKN